jgi:phosphatidylserine/phosphatidylglycerophosphate/cardiolipin synthase-like enzyme
MKLFILFVVSLLIAQTSFAQNISFPIQGLIGKPLFSDPTKPKFRGIELEDTIVNAIKRATKSIRIEMFDLSNKRIGDALKEADLKSDVDVYIVLNQRNWKKGTRKALHDRDSIHLAIGKCPGYYHTKVLIVDSEAVYVPKRFM